MNTDTIKNNIARLIKDESDESVLLTVKKMLEESTLKNLYEQRAKRAEADIEANKVYDAVEIRRLTDRHIHR